MKVTLSETSMTSLGLLDQDAAWSFSRSNLAFLVAPRLRAFDQGRRLDFEAEADRKSTRNEFLSNFQGYPLAYKKN